MKKLLIIMACMVTSYQLASASDDKAITTDKLPAAAQQFMKAHFNNVAILSATVDNGFFDKEYKAYLKGGATVEFDNNGQWTEVKCKPESVPASIIPQSIKTFIAQNHPAAKVIEIDQDKTGYDVKLSGGVELKFDTAANFVRYDD